MPAWASCVSSEPTPDEMTSTGIRVPGPKSVAESGAVRPGRPSFAISAAAAPPACAIPAFCENGQPPRRMSAIAAERETGEVRIRAAARARDRDDLSRHVPAARVAHRQEVAVALVANEPGQDALEHRRLSSRGSSRTRRSSAGVGGRQPGAAAPHRPPTPSTPACLQREFPCSAPRPPRGPRGAPSDGPAVIARASA